ncbi:NADH-quinone oxidoreductase subunit N [Desulfallas thermosapovorans]|uniref:NADH-quinone oxidoreductase subunit N n=1 Tax=Desulfallas thermosapovorans DSM 6562 TaxID=1121431 RepID=A0A5S4ZRB9_9FIRM|nr:NADH-quinone oxidoreductase subunit N [Desulfallas thermosapovorans]TYO95169.1 NADH dehydrogenase subunit N [Desulfallas thermosapovorans DSM 6562]
MPADNMFVFTLPFDPSALTLEMLTAVLALGVLIMGIVVPRGSKHGLGWVSLLGILGIMAVAVSLWGDNRELLSGMYLLDNYALFWKITFLTAAALVILGCMRYVDDTGFQTEYYSLTVFATLGMMVMASAGDFITFYLGLELMTLSFVILVCFRKSDSKSVEAGIKYLLLAGMSSAVLLYGLSLIYGLTGSITILEVSRIIAMQPLSPALMLAVVMVIAGLGFKISAVPFHMWSPDVYEGAPTPVTAFLAVGSKAASLAIIVRLFIAGLPGIWEHWAMVIAILAAVTIIVGNLVAIPQTNIKRMLAYSSIAQAGYIMVGLVTATEAGIKGVMFYAFLYVFATMAAFTVVAYYYNVTGSDELKDYAGLAQRSPLMAAVMLVALLSMAGIPPLAGFAGKFYLFKTIVDGYLWLVFIGLIMSMVSVYYYLRVALVMYRDDPVDATPIKVSSPVAVTLIVATIATLVIGVYPGPLSEVVNNAAHTFFLH